MSDKDEFSIDIGPLPAIGTAEISITSPDGRVFRQRLDGLLLQQRPAESEVEFMERLRAAAMERLRALAAAVAEAPPDERKH